MGLFGITTGKDNIHFGNHSDVCTLCEREKSQAERMGVSEANIKLRGELEGKKLLKIPISGTNVIICFDHLHRLSDANREVTPNDE